MQLETLIEMMRSGQIDCRTLRVHPEDTIIINSLEYLTKEQVVEVIKKFSAFFPGHMVLVFHSGSFIEVQSVEK